jgi:hypothetical protein
MGSSRDISEEGGGIGVAAEDKQMDNSGYAQAAATAPQTYQPTAADRRREAIYAATSTAAGHPITAEELIKRAKLIEAYINDDESK